LWLFGFLYWSSTNSLTNSKYLQFTGETNKEYLGWSLTVVYRIKKLDVLLSGM
jgi:hypothetical protein